MTTNFSRGISTWRFLRLCWRAPLILITCAGILTENVEPISQAQRFLFSSKIATARVRQCVCPGDIPHTPARIRTRLYSLCYNGNRKRKWMGEAVNDAALNSREMTVVNDCSKLRRHGLRRPLQAP